jgi:hypothetical protein
LGFKYKRSFSSIPISMISSFSTVFIQALNAHHHWRAGYTDFEKNTLTPTFAWATVARPCESSAWFCSVMKFL